MIQKLAVNSLKSFLCGMLISSLSLGTMLSASAYSSTKSSKSTMSAVGNSYEAYNTIITGIEGSNPHKYARAYTDISAEKNLPGGYMGVQPIMYNSSGNVVSTGTWSYSSSNTSGMSRSVTYTGFSGSPAVYSKGYVKIWNGTEYWTYNTFPSPNLNDYT